MLCVSACGYVQEKVRKSERDGARERESEREHSFSVFKGALLGKNMHGISFSFLQHQSTFVVSPWDPFYKNIEFVSLQVSIHGPVKAIQLDTFV